MTVHKQHIISLCAIIFVVAMSAIIFLPTSHTQTAHAATFSVLFDDDHAEQAGNADWVISSSIPDPLAQNANPSVETDWTGGISAWGVALQKTGRYSLKTNNAALTYGTNSALDLKNFNELVLPEPNTLFTASEKTAIITFVKNGGGLFMIADHTGSDRNNDGADSLQVLNDLMSNNSVQSDPFGIQYDAVNIASENPANDTPNAASDPILNGAFGTATGTILRNGTTETLETADNANAQGDIYRASASNTGTTNVVFAHSTYGSGRVAAMGDSSAIDDGTCASGNTCYNGWNDSSAQNDILFPNATDWLSGYSSGGTTTPTPTPTTPPGSTPTATPTTPPGSTPTATATPISGGSNLISNGGFESVGAAWTESSSAGYEIVDTAKPHSGSYSADFCGANNCSDSIYQQVSIPASASSATLNYFWYVTTTETKHSYDYLYVRVRNSSGSTLSTVQTISDGSTTGSWQSASYDLSSYKGSTIQLAFVATNGSKNPTEFYLDDVSLNVA
jgi:Immune inhibitor A peptidase M6/MAM domain, meprin/A5/mu